MVDGEINRRRFPRIRTENPVHVVRVGREPGEGTGKTASLGLGGCMFEVKEQLGTDAVVDILISVRPREVIEAKGRVVYEQPKGERTFEVGVEFLSISEPDRAALQRLFEGPPLERA